MTTIAIDLPNPLMTAENLRSVDGDLYAKDLADAIEAAADKRVIVLDVEQVGSRSVIHDLRMLASQTGKMEAREVIQTVADALDSLTPPRPPEPKGLGAVVESGAPRYTWVRTWRESPEPWVLVGNHRERVSWAHITAEYGEPKVLSEGVPG